MAIGQVSEDGQVTIPAVMLKELGLEPGSTVAIRLQEGQIVIHPVRSVRDLRGVFAEAAKGKPTDWETIREETYRIMAEEYAKEHGLVPEPGEGETP